MIVLTGGTGSIGRHLVAALRDAKAPHRVVVRHPDRATHLESPTGTVVYGDLDEPATLVDAFAGADQLFLNAAGAVPVVGAQPMVGQQIAAIAAAQSVGISHIVKVSVWQAGIGRPLAEGAHAEIEQYLRSSAVPATVLQPSGFMQNLLTGVAGITPDGNLIDPYLGGAVSYIDAADIATCAAAILTLGAGRGGTHILTGPQALTTADLALELSTRLGRDIGTHPLSAEALRAGILAQGLPAEFADAIVALSNDVASGTLSATTTAVAELTGRPARHFSEFITDNIDALRASFVR